MAGVTNKTLVSNTLMQDATLLLSDKIDLQRLFKVDNSELFGLCTWVHTYLYMLKDLILGLSTRTPFRQTVFDSMSITSSTRLEDINTTFSNHAARPKFHEAVYSGSMKTPSPPPSGPKLTVDYEHALRMFRSADAVPQKRTRQEPVYKLERFDRFINISELAKDFRMLTRRDEQQGEHSIFRTIDDYITAGCRYLASARYDELDTLKTESLTSAGQYCKLVIDKDDVVVADPSSAAKRLFSPLCFLQLCRITVHILMDERFKFDPQYDAVLILLTAASLAYYHDLISMMRAPLVNESFVRYMTSLQGSGKSMEFYTAACLLRRAGYPVIFINNWIDINTVTAFAPILILEMYGMFCSIGLEDGKQYVKQFIREYETLLADIEDSRGRAFKEKVLLSHFVHHCAGLVYHGKGCRLCLIIDQINTPFGAKAADGSLFEFFRGLLTERLLVQVYISSANNDTDRREELFKHTSMKLMPKLTKLPSKELLLLAHASSTSSGEHLEVSLNPRKGSFVFTEIDAEGCLSWREGTATELLHFNTGGIPYYLVHFCRSLGNTAAAKASSFHQTLNIRGSIAYYKKSFVDKDHREALFKNMLRIFLGLGGSALAPDQPYDRRYIYEEELPNEDGVVVYRFVSQFVYDAFQSVYGPHLEKSIFDLLEIPSPSMLDKDLSPSARGSITELYLISVLARMRGLLLPSASKDGSLFSLPALQLVRLFEFELRHPDLASGDYLLRPPSRHPIHDAYILLQSAASVKQFLNFLHPPGHPSSEQSGLLGRSGVLFALQITIGDAKAHYRRDRDVSPDGNPRKYEVLAEVADFVRERNLYYAEIYISPRDPQDALMNWWSTNDLCPWFTRWQ